MSYCLKKGWHAFCGLGCWRWHGYGYWVLKSKCEGKFVNLKFNNDFVETYKATTDSHKSERQPSTSSCEESLECPEDIGVPIQKDGSQSHVSKHCDEEDDIWREVRVNICGVQGPSQIQTVVCFMLCTVCSLVQNRLQVAYLVWSWVLYSCWLSCGISYRFTVLFIFTKSKGRI